MEPIFLLEMVPPPPKSAAICPIDEVPSPQVISAE